MLKPESNIGYGVWRTGATALLFAGALIVVAFALERLAHWQLRTTLIAEAALALERAAIGATPYRWPMRSAADLIAGRAFGEANTRFGDDGMELTARDNGIVEIGLPLPRRVDLQRYDDLQLTWTGDQGASTQVLVGEALDRDTGQCLSSPIDTPPGERIMRIGLANLAWTCDGEPGAAPARAAMVRLRWELARGQSVGLADVRLSRPATAPIANAAQLVDSAVALPPTSARRAFADRVATLNQAFAAPRLPIVTLPLTGRVEQVLAARDAVLAQAPATIVPPADSMAQVLNATARASQPPSHRSTWIFALLNAAGLLAIGLRKPGDPKARAALEIAGVLAGPLFIVVGGYFGDKTNTAVGVIITCSLLFAASLLPRSMKLGELAGQWRGWMIPLATVIVACAFVAIVRVPDTAPGEGVAGLGSTRSLRYLVWAGVQQVLICVILSPRVRVLWASAAWTALAVAVMFSLLHTPNAMLMQVCLFGGLAWVWNWQRHRALLPNILAHAACGLILVAELPPDWLRSAEVSLRYFL